MATTDYSSLIAELQDIWYEKIPLSKSMELTISSFDGVQLVTQARLEPNVNVHGTAFAGSLYAIQALTGWGMMHLQTRILAIYEVRLTYVFCHFIFVSFKTAGKYAQYYAVEKKIWRFQAAQRS